MMFYDDCGVRLVCVRERRRRREEKLGAYVRRHRYMRSYGLLLSLVDVSGSLRADVIERAPCSV